MALFAFLDTLDRGLPSERRGYPKRPAVSLPTSRNNSTTSINSLRSEPGWINSVNGVDRGRSTSSSSSPSSSSATPSSKTKQPSSNSGGGGGGFGQFFKSKKDKKEGTDRVVVTSQHAAAVRARLARDPKYDRYRNKGKNDKNKRDATPNNMVGTPNTLHLSAEQQEMRHPHSGPPALSPPVDKSDLPVLDRVISGDEVDDEPDQWERMRHEWKRSKVPDTHMSQVIEGEALESGASSGTSTPREVEVCLPVSDKRDDNLKSLDAMKSTKERPKPQRRHTPIGGRYTKDERGVWKK